MAELKNARHELFAQAVARGVNLFHAYQEAGYKGTPSALQANASRLIGNDKVSARISELKKAGAEKALVEVADVLKGFLRICNADLADAFDEQGNMKLVRDMPKDLRLALAGIDIDEIIQDGRKIGYTKKLKLCDKKGSWDSLARYLKMFVERVEHGVDENLASILEQTKWRPPKKE